MSTSTPAVRVQSESGTNAAPVVPNDRPPGGIPPVADTTSAKATPRIRIVGFVPWLLLIGFVVTFSVIMFDVAWTSYANVTPGGVGGATDLSIMMQALTSTAHGYIPFYESPDCVHSARCSLLLVHPALMLYALVPVYALDPTPSLLFALQSVAVALAAVPLFLLASDLGRSRWKGLIAAGVYLLFLPTISSIDFSFHVEPFLPLELFTLFWLWRGQRYWIGSVVAVISCLTFEVNPVLIFFFGVFFLWPFVVSAGRDLFVQVRDAAPGRQIASTIRRQAVAFVRSPGARAARAAVVLMVLCLGAYLFLRLFVEHSTLFGLPALPARYVLPIGRPNPQIQFQFIFGGSFDNWFLYWGFAFALLGFVGLLVPRTLWLALPWAAYSALSNSPNYTILGLHYGVVAAIPLLIGFAYGLAKLPLGRTPSGISTSQRRRFRVGRAVGWTVVIVVVAANLALTPLSPLATPLAQSELPVYAQYPSSLTAQPDAAALQKLGSLVPQDSTLLAPYLLLPFVANDIYAYPYPPGTTRNLPFPAPALPAYVLTDPRDVSSLPTNVLHAIGNSSTYGTLAVVPTTPLGLVTLYEKSYRGATEVLGAPVPVGSQYSPKQLKPSGNGTALVAVAGTPFGEAVQSRTTSVVGSALFETPALSLAPGNYTLSAQLWVKLLNSSSNPGDRFLWLNFTGTNGDPISSLALRYASYSPATWFTVSFVVSVPTSIYGGDEVGVLASQHNGYEVECASVSITG